MKKTYVIALLLFVAAVGAVIFLVDTPTTRAFQTKVMEVLSPFIKAGAVTETEVRHAVETPLDAASLRREVERLTQQNAHLRIIADKYQSILDENNKFRAMWNYEKQIPEKLIAAHVLRRSAATWWMTLIINKGSIDGIGTDCPVITDAGLVGKTGKVASRTAEVLLLTDEECRVAARIQGTQARGILSGERGDLEARPELRLRFLDRTANIVTGATVYSTGDGRVFPANVPLGKIKSVEPRDVSLEAVVDPAVDFSLIEDVFVLQKEPAAK